MTSSSTTPVSADPISVAVRGILAMTELTHTERRVAELAAQGSTSAEIAAAQFMSGKTVEGNLTRVYRKLGVRNRTGLSSRLLGHRD